MMVKYKNYMETLVEQRFDEMKDELDCCTCEDCRNDVIAFALNQLPSKYIVSHKGEMYSKVNILSTQYNADIVTAIAAGVNVVKKHPSHD